MSRQDSLMDCLIPTCETNYNYNHFRYRTGTGLFVGLVWADVRMTNQLVMTLTLHTLDAEHFYWA